MVGHLFAAQHGPQDVGLHDANEISVRALCQRLVLVSIAASIINPARTSIIRTQLLQRTVCFTRQHWKSALYENLWYTARFNTAHYVELTRGQYFQARPLHNLQTMPHRQV